MKLELQSDTGSAIEIDITELGMESLNEAHYLTYFFAETPSRMLLMCCFEIAKTDGFYQRDDPEWEFLRHCRNAAAHNGKFKFENDEPRRHAEWRGKTIEREREGDPLLTPDSNGSSFLLPGDVIRLLTDLDKKISET